MAPRTKTVYHFLEENIMGNLDGCLFPMLPKAGGAARTNAWRMKS
jgi:hypothetical protein